MDEDSFGDCERYLSSRSYGEEILRGILSILNIATILGKISYEIIETILLENYLLEKLFEMLNLIFY